MSLALHVPPMGIYQQELAHYQKPEWGPKWSTMISKGWEGPLEGPGENQSESRGTWRAVALCFPDRRGWRGLDMKKRGLRGLRRLKGVVWRAPTEVSGGDWRTPYPPTVFATWLDSHFHCTGQNCQYSSETFILLTFFLI